MRNKNGTFKCGKLHPCWKGDKATKRSIHKWLEDNFGTPNKCENIGCVGISKRFEWANLKNHKYYSRKREDYKRLCHKCHALLDRRKSHCHNGHKLTEENCYYKPNGKRECRICRQLFNRSYFLKHKDELNAKDRARYAIKKGLK